MPQRRLPWFALLLLPGLARADSLSAVDTVWIAVAAALVFFMQAGFALLESGMSRAKNALNVVMKNYMDLISNEFGACLVLSTDRVLAEESRKILRDGRRKVDHAVRDLLRKGMEEDSISPCDPKIAAAALFGAFNWVPRWHLTGDRQAYANIANDFMEIFLNGLRQQPADAG